MKRNALLRGVAWFSVAAAAVTATDATRPADWPLGVALAAALAVALVATKGRGGS
jgi:peptidoglycan/LPS O-acetylase OafA/YrhL